MKSPNISQAVQLLGLSLLAVGLSAGLASAQQSVGKVTLPVKTHWGNAVLPAGEYTFLIDPALPSVITVRQGEKRVAMILSTDGVMEDQRIVLSELVGIRRGSEFRVRTLRLADSHLAIFYPQPKGQPQYSAESRPQLIEHVSIAMTGR